MNYFYSLLIIFGFLFSGCLNNNKVERESFNLPVNPTHKLTEVFFVHNPEFGVYFDLPLDVITLSNNNLLIRNANKVEFYELNENGKLISTFGKKGRGPGEFNRISQVVITPDDILHVFDYANGRQKIMEKIDGEWQVIKGLPFKSQPSGLTSQIPEIIIDTVKGGYKAVFTISPSSSIIDTLSFRFAYTNIIDKELRPIGVARFYKPINSVAILRSGRISSFSFNPYFFRGFYLYDKTNVEIIYFSNTSNIITALTQEGSTYKKGYLPYDQFAVNEKAFERISLYGSDMANKIKNKILPHEPFYKNAIISENKIWLQIARKDTTKPNWVVTDLSGEILKSFKGPNFYGLISAQNNRLTGIIVREDKAYIASYELQALTSNHQKVLQHTF